MSDKPIRPAASYAALYPLLAEKVRPLGYALAIHGSMARDMDLVAVPWVRKPERPERVFEAIKEAVDGVSDFDNVPGIEVSPGRRGWLIWFRDAGGEALADRHPNIDLSVIDPGWIEADRPGKGKRDKCQVCDGWRGGTPGNENVLDGLTVCDYCASTMIRLKRLGWPRMATSPTRGTRQMR